MKYYEKLKQIREDSERTQKEVADQLKTTKQQIGKYERGEQQMTVERLKEFCEYYGVSADYILGLPKGLSWPRSPK